jgi:hypothetical protein
MRTIATREHSRSGVRILAGKRWRFPKWKALKINPESVAHFSASKKRPLTDHIYHAYHHKLTIKTPQYVTPFFEKPPVKPHFNHHPHQQIKSGKKDD